ncbi:hypothetical protein [Flavobacterium luteolum]|uniref:hypothetical protein n=1 Tax=Flavobacterium luteolum TaxID=3003259 RepID=UPI00248D5394|nr:hypothetical protein [Flavobacterium luteolum]
MSKEVMNVIFAFSFVFLFSIPMIRGQEIHGKMLSGLIISDSIPLEGAVITNLNSKLQAVSDHSGRFYLHANKGENLSFSASGLKTITELVNQNMLNSDPYTFYMEAAANELKEVIIKQYPEINAEKLGITKPGQVKFTPAERKLYSGSSGIVGLINLFSGELKTLKANVNVEKKENSLQKLDHLLEDKYYTQDLKIPAELIKGFKYYCIEDDEFVKTLRSKDRFVCMFLIIELASEYNRKRAEINE